MNNKRNSPDTPTYVSAAFVLSVPIESIPDLKSRIIEGGAVIVYQKVSAGRLEIVAK